MKCTNCGRNPNTVDELRQCHMCQSNGTAGAIHCKYPGGTTVEALVADNNANAFPFVHDDVPETEPTAVIEDAEEPSADTATVEQIERIAAAVHDAFGTPGDGAPEWDQHPEEMKEICRIYARGFAANPDAKDEEIFSQIAPLIAAHVETTPHTWDQLSEQQHADFARMREAATEVLTAPI